MKLCKSTDTCARPDVPPVPVRPPCRASSTGAFLMLLVAMSAANLPAVAEGEFWTDKDLVAAYSGFGSRGELEKAVLTPALPSEPPRPEFLDALAWFAAGAPDRAGTLTLDQLDRFIHSQCDSYLRLLTAKVERGVENDYARTRTWKVIQKLTLLREEMSGMSGEGRHAYPAIVKVPGGDDAWEREHTIGSVEEFKEKVCRASRERPVLVKFGNTNCTQCMLFELIGSVREFAESPAHRDEVDVYKVWWGLRPDESFAGKERDPARLDELVHAEGIRSSPAFVVYRNGGRYPCEDAFPDYRGMDDRLDSCLRQQFGEVPPEGMCAQ